MTNYPEALVERVMDALRRCNALDLNECARAALDASGMREAERARDALRERVRVLEQAWEALAHDERVYRDQKWADRVQRALARVGLARIKREPHA